MVEAHSCVEPQTVPRVLAVEGGVGAEAGGDVDPGTAGLGEAGAGGQDVLRLDPVRAVVVDPGMRTVHTVGAGLTHQARGRVP